MKFIFFLLCFQSMSIVIFGNLKMYKKYFSWKKCAWLEHHLWMQLKIVYVLLYAHHNGRFWEILAENWGKTFYSIGFIFTSFLNILSSKAKNLWIIYQVLKQNCNCRDIISSLNFGTRISQTGHSEVSGY